MRPIRPSVRRRFRLAIRRRALRERDVDDEIALHIDLRAEQLMRGGMAPEDARTEALRRFGALTDARARLLDAARERDTRMTWSDRLDTLRRDVAYAARQLRTAPSVAAAAVLILALGIGANATMFGVVDRLLLSPPPHVADAAALTRLHLEPKAPIFGMRVVPIVSYPGYRAVREHGRDAFVDVAAFFSTERVVGTPGGGAAGARPVRLVEATGNYFALLGARAALGRLFSPDDDRLPSGNRVAVLGDGYWRREFGGAADAVGQSILVEGERYQVIGVAPRGFNGSELRPIDVYVPVAALAAQEQGPGWHLDERAGFLTMLARRRPGVTVARAEAAATAALRAPEVGTRGFTHGARVVSAPLSASLEPKQREGSGASASVATWLAGVAAVVLLIACANVANLLVLRALRRRREIAVRVALGAPRGRLARQLLTESALLAALGAVVGLAFARVGGAVVRAALFPDVDWSTPVVDARVLLFALAATTLTALLTGVAPVLHVRALGVQAGLRAGVRAGGGRRAPLRTTLLLAQGTLSVVLLVGAGLFVRSLLRVGALDFGYDQARLLVVDAQFPESVPRAERRAALDRMLERATRLPGVAGAGVSSTSPFWSFGMGDVSVPDVDSADAVLRGGPVVSNVVSAGYLAAVGTRVVRGRPIGAADVLGAPRVALVNEAMARRVWKGADPIGRCIRVGGDTMPCSEVVGVVQNTLLVELREPPVMQYYVPLAQQAGGDGGNLLVRAEGDPAALASTLRREMAAAAPTARYVDVLPLSDRVAPQTRPWRLGATAFGAFGVLALLIASVGLYSVMAYAVAQRLHELGLRMALGARARDVVGLVLRQGLAVAAAGIVLGAAVALAGGRWIAPLLFDVSPRDPLVFGGVAGTLLAAALAATLLPARRATRASPGDALRAE